MGDRGLLYTDGSCLGNPGPGGWAWLEVSTGAMNSGGELATTNQRMELLAVCEGLGTTEGEILVRSDSLYVVNCFRQQWWKRWQTNGYRNAQGRAVANKDLWVRLLDQVFERDRSVEFEWVKGHSIDPYNDRVDQLAQAAAAAMRP
ncbi:MAG: ribonuclease H family protein [Ferrimicrobium sp.]